MKKRVLLLILIVISVLCACVVGLKCYEENKIYELITYDKPQKDTYDVIVIGSDPEGIAAAYTAGKEGLSTLLIDFNREMVGGLYTLGELNMIDFNRPPEGANFFGRDTDFINKGFFEKFYHLIGERQSFDIMRAKEAFESLLAESETEVVLTSGKINKIQYDKLKKENTLSMNCGDSERLLKAKVVIDATGNADIAKIAGAKFYEGKEDLGLKGIYQAATLVYRLKNIDWKKVEKFLESDGSEYTDLTDNAAWGYEIMTKCKVTHPRLQSRGLNLGRQNDGTVLVNALQIFDFNPYQEDTKAIQEICIKTIKTEILPFMRKNCPGFEHAEFVSIAPEFYVRESRHMKGEATLRAGDVFDSIFSDNFVASGSYPMDVQTHAKGQFGVSYQDKVIYGIDAGVCVPKDTEGIFVVSKSLSMDSIAYGSARTVPVLVSIAEASGAMSKIMVEDNLSTKEVIAPKYTSKIRKILKRNGVHLKAYPHYYKHDYDSSYAIEELRILRNMGLIDSQMLKKERLKNTVTVNYLMGLVTRIEERIPKDKLSFERLKILKVLYPHQNLVDSKALLSYEDMIKTTNVLLNKEYKSFVDMQKDGILSQTVSENLTKKQSQNKQIDEEDFFAIMGSITKMLPLIHA